MATFHHKPLRKFNLDGVSENRVKIGDNTIVFTADSKDLAGTVKISDKTDKALIDKEIKSLQRDYDLTDDGELQDYLGTRFE